MVYSPFGKGCIEGFVPTPEQMLNPLYIYASFIPELVLKTGWFQGFGGISLE
jgi:hypothetical protein